MDISEITKEELISKIEDLEIIVESKNLEISSLEKEFSDLEYEFSDLEDSVKDLKTENQELIFEIESLKEQMFEYNTLSSEIKFKFLKGLLEKINVEDILTNNIIISKVIKK